MVGCPLKGMTFSLTHAPTSLAQREGDMVVAPAALTSVPTSTFNCVPFAKAGRAAVDERTAARTRARRMAPRFGDAQPVSGAAGCQPRRYKSEMSALPDV